MTMLKTKILTITALVLVPGVLFAQSLENEVSLERKKVGSIISKSALSETKRSEQWQASSNHFSFQDGSQFSERVIVELLDISFLKKVRSDDSRRSGFKEESRLMAERIDIVREPELIKAQKIGVSETSAERRQTRRYSFAESWVSIQKEANRATFGFEKEVGNE